MHSLINTLIGGLSAAFIFGFIAQKCKLSPIIGYLFAGILISSNTPGFVADIQVANHLAEIGVVLLMFGVGLHFHLKDLLAVQKVALPGAAVQITAATVLGMLVSHMFGWSWTAGAVYGMSISVASTVVLTRVLSDNKALHTPSGHVALGWLVVEDLFTILALVLLPVVFAPGASAGDIWASLGWTIIKLGGFVLLALIGGQKLIPLMLTYVARTGTRDLFTLAVLAIALGIALAAYYIFGASMALGAFLAGMVVGQSEFSARAAAEALPMRDAFAVLFFVSVGMLFDPFSILNNWPLALATLGIVMIGKPLAALVVVLLLRKPARMALVVAVALAQVGEFSFILADQAILKWNILPAEASSAIILAAIISITLNPIIFKGISSWTKVLEKYNIGKTPLAGDDCSTNPQPDKERIIIVGYGPLGRTLGRILLANDIDVVVVEMNIDTVKDLKLRKEFAIYGDATQIDVLKHAGAEHASGLIISSSGIPAREVVKAAKELNPGIRTIAYSTYLREAEALRNSGASVVFSGEREVAISMAEWLLQDLQATDEQIERERRRIRSELL